MAFSIDTERLSNSKCRRNTPSLSTTRTANSEIRNLDTNRVCFHDARTVTVTKKSRLAIRHWG